MEQRLAQVHLQARALKEGARYGIRPAVRRAVWDIEDVFERAYEAQLELVRQPYKERILERLQSGR